jgi:hypothetical protein
MPVDIDFEKSDTAIVMTISGQMNAAEVVCDYQAVLNSPRFRPGLHSVWDLSRLDLIRVPISEIRALPRLLRSEMSTRGEGFKVALVTIRKTDYQLIRMYIAILKLIGDRQFRVFESVAEAMVWVNDKTSE